ncbi:MAG: DUF459 domain-containing protein [Acidimicrobiia bacterium]
MNLTSKKDEQYNSKSKTSKHLNRSVLVSNTDAPHRVMSAGQTIVFVFLTLIIGIILNSSPLYTRATTMKDSTFKTITLNVLKPFDKASRAVGFTSLRQKPREALSLGRDDKIDTFTFKNVKPVKAIAPKKVLPALSPTNKLSLWIIGDSLAITPGESMLKTFSTDYFDIQGLDGQVSTGLARPDVFNWFTHINDYVVARKPKAVVITFGANDDQYLFSSSGPIGPFGSDAWKKEYSTRVSSTLDFLINQGVHPIWIAIPPVRDPVRDARYKIINDVTRAATEARPETTSYIETAKAFTNPDGSYSDSININGTLTLLRAPDGIHFTRDGGNVISNLVIEKLHTLYSFK